MAEEVKKKQSNIALTVLIVGAILFGAAAMSAATLALINSQNSNKKVYTASYLASEVVKKMNYENLSEISPSDISNYYDIPEGVVTDSAMFVSTRSDSYTEIACFKLKSNESEKQLTKSIDNYISAKKKTYRRSLPVCNRGYLTGQRCRRQYIRVDCIQYRSGKRIKRYSRL